MNIDVTIADWMVEHRGPIVDHFSRGVMWLGTGLTGIAVCAALVVALAVLRRRPSIILGTGCAVVIATAASTVLKSQIGRPRPGPRYAEVSAVGYSMPSTAAAMCTAGLVVLLLLAPSTGAGRLTTGAVLLIFDLVVGYALIYLGAHWFTDVCAGALLGAAIGGGALLLTDRISKHSRGITASYQTASGSVRTHDE